MDEVLVLHFPENAEPLCQGVDRVDDGGGVFGELVPWDVGFVAGFLENGGKVFFDELKVDGHIWE